MNETVITKPAQVALAGPKVLLMGPSGTGKTYSLGTLVDWASAHNKEVFALFTENGLETLLGYWKDRGLEVPACLHWHQELTRSLGLAAMISGAEKVGQSTYEMLTKMVDMNRGGENNSFWKILRSCSDFTDDRTGKHFGSIEAFGPDKIFITDSLSELSVAAMKMQVGIKPMAAPQDYGVAQQYIIGWLRLVTQSIGATFVLTAHVDRILDTVSQTTKTMVKSAGKALADEIPPLFSDVIYTERVEAKFTWSTAAFGVDSKTRSLGYRANIAPDFAQIMDLWLKRGGV